MTTLQPENVPANLSRVDADVRQDGSLDLWEITNPGTPQENAGFAVRLSPQGWASLVALFAHEHHELFAIMAMMAQAKEGGLS